MIGSLLGVVASIINTRYLDSINYGDVRYVQNIINFMSTLLLFGYFLSGSRLLALSCDENKSARIRGVMVIILLLSIAILMFGTFVNYLLHLNNSKVSILFLYSIPVCAFPLLTNYINTTAQGDNHIGRIASARVFPYALYIIVSYFIYNKFGATSSRMVLLQWGIYSFILVIIVLSTRPSFQNLKFEFRALNNENRTYGIQLYYGSLAMLATNYIAGITLGLFNSDNQNVGFYTLALTITSTLSTLPGAIGTTYFREFATQNRIPSKVMRFTILITLASCILFILLINPIVRFLYSEEYANVGIYASWMSIGFCLHGFGDMINRYLGSHGQGKQIRNASYFCGATRVVGFTIFVYFWNIEGAIITNILSSSVYCFILLKYYKSFVNKCLSEKD